MPKRVYRRAYASLRVFGDDLHPPSVTKALHLPPDHQHHRGEPRIGRTKAGMVHESAPYQQGLWSMSSEQWVQSPRLAVHLEWLLDQLEPKREELQELAVQGYGLDFFCYSSGTTDRPPSLPKGVRTRAANLRIPINIDHYPVSDD